MRFKGTLLFILFSLLLLSAQAATDMASPLPVDPELIIGKLPNGITYYIKVNKTPAKRAELRLVVNVGSVQEDDDQRGLAHFTEHMAFNGTKHFKKQELVDYLNSIGMGFMGGLNAGTGMDNTTYQLPTPTETDEQLRKAILILSDWANGVSFDTDEIERERGIIIEEYRGNLGAAERIYNKQRQVIFQGSKYAQRMPIGTLDVLQTFQPETIKRFYQDWYRPDLQAVVCVGDFDPVKVENLIKEYFTNIPPKANPRPCELYPVPDNQQPLVTIVTDKEAPETDVQLIWKHEREVTRTVGEYRTKLLTNLYTQMLNARLQELAQQAEPPFSQAFNYKYNIVRSKSNYAMMAIVPDTGIQTGLTALLTEAERVRRYGFTASELERAKQQSLRMGERMLAEKDKQDSDRLIWRYVSSYTYNNPVMSIEQNVALNNELYTDITLDEVNALCRQLVTDKNMIIAVSAPEKEGLIIPESAELLALLDMVKKSAITPYLDATTDEPLLGKLPPAGNIKSEKNFPSLGIKVWTLSNGVKVYTKQTDFKNDEISIRAFSPGGTSLYPLVDLFEAREAASVVAESGVGSFTASALDKKISGKLLSIDPYITSTEEGLRGTSSKADLETLMQLIWLYSTSPKVDKDSFASWKSRTRAYMENEVLDPEKAYNDSTQALIYNHHPRSKDMSALDLEALDMNRIIQIYQERFGNAADFSYIIVGNFDEKILRSLCEKYLAALPSTGKQEKVTDTGIRYTKGKHDLKVYKGQDQKSTVQYIISGTAKYSSQTRSELYNLTYLLNEKLRENIRETRSGVYFVGAWPQLKQYPVPTYQITIYMQCAPERVEELSAAIISTLDSLKTGSIDAKYVNAVKMTRTKKLETDKKENQWWMNNIYEQAWNKQPLAGMLIDEQVINKMSIRSLQKSTAKYLMHDKNLLRSVLLPEDWKDK